MRRVALVVAALVGASTVPTAAPSVAAGSCTITTPSKIVVDREFREYPVSFSGACTTGSGPGSAVTLTSKVTAYNTSASAFRPKSGATVKFYSKNSDGTWSYKGSAKTGSTGSARLTVTSSTKRIWKAVTVESPTTWGSTSATATR